MTSTKHKIVVEQHEDGFVAYPLGVVGCIVGKSDSADGAVKDLRSAIHFHIETFGKDAFQDDSSVLHAFLTEIDVPNPH